VRAISNYTAGRKLAKPYSALKNKYHLLLQNANDIPHRRLKLDQTPHNRSATSPTNALISFFRTFSFPASPSFPFSVSPTCKTLSRGTS
jgi:hypothetical protein